MSIRNDLVQAARTWLKAAATLTDAQVKDAHRAFQVPQGDYLVVRCLTPGRLLTLSPEKEYVDNAGTMQVVVGGKYEADLAVQAFGDSALDWLEDARLALATWSMMDTTHAEGVAFLAGDVVSLNELMPATVQPRAVMDVKAWYRVRRAPETVVQLESVDLGLTINETGGAPLMVSSTPPLP